MKHVEKKNYTCDRVLALREKGISNEAIAVRLGVSRSHIGGYVKNALERRAREQATEAAS